jgi:dUTP pyrophosphatase
MYIYSRSSFGYKYDVCLTNCVGVIDSDYYNNPDNEGHFQVKLTNHGDKDFEINIGDRIGQCVFMKYLVVDDEEEITEKRKGGLGSTGKGE